jgi:outer membrane protein assembly factor BamD
MPSAFGGSSRLITSVALLLLASACAGTQIEATAPAEKAEGLYFDGMEYLREGAFLEAQQTFAEALKLPGYLQVTALARARLGDAYYFQYKYAQAIEHYESYARRHEGSTNVPYARFMVAKSYFQKIPTDFWLLPPVYEMDLSSADKARYHLEHFMRRFPLSVHATEASSLRDRCIDLQLAHHGYVVQFYVDRKKWIGAVFRLHEVMRKFPIRAHTLQNYKVLAIAYQTLGWRRRSLQINRAIAQRWAHMPEAAEARGKVATARAAIARFKAQNDPAAEMPAELPPTAKYRPEALSSAGG